ncbi:hypothetical protein LR48_Vigan10g181400 [Vigna angularis]|uniref:Uncharacterized protein n=1 Tax=Phaseolus angularis TaxID=3914 RepID=A0A0L9VLZ7_PHAAN|nr:hypothetical protein LR48_Vigan10g181400 [Vigna angularis]
MASSSRRGKRMALMVSEGNKDKANQGGWTSIAGFHQGGEKAHLGIEGLHKFSMYQDCLRDPNQPCDYSLYRTGGMKKDDNLYAFVIAWILFPSGSNHAQLTIEDICIIHALKENIQTDWAATILINMIKLTRLDVTCLPYVVFISKVLHHYNVDYIEESCETYDENQNEEDVHATHNVSSSSGAFRPKTEFEKFIVRQMHSLSTLYQSHFDKIDKDIAAIQEKVGIQSLSDDDEDEEEAMEEDENGDDDEEESEAD